MEEKVLTLKCGYCEQRTIFKIIGEDFLDQSRETYDPYPKDPFTMQWERSALFLKCRTCKEPTLVIRLQEFFIDDELDQDGFEKEKKTINKETIIVQYPSKDSSALEIPPPDEDMPKDIRELYTEAAKVFPHSARASTALLRLALEKLIRSQLKNPADNMNLNIKQLKKRGIPEQLLEALHAVRLVGNEAVHPGQIDFRDEPDIALTLFQIINFIVRKLISWPEELNNI